MIATAVRLVGLHGARTRWQHAAMKITLLLILIAGLFEAMPAQAWGSHGHELIAEIAARNLRPDARRQVERLLGDRANLAMREVSTWPDKIRDQPKYRATTPLHYLNFTRGNCAYVSRAQCRDGRCVVGAIEQQVKRLADRSLSNDQRAEALAFVIHFVGDIHQPMHAGWQDDRGGNDYQVRVGRSGMNMHALWDQYLTRQTGLRVREHADKLLATPITSSRLTWDRAQPVAWALESCRIVERDVYPSSPVIGDDYVRRTLPIAEERIELAGRRLAVLLNAVLAD